MVQNNLVRKSKKTQKVSYEQTPSEVVVVLDDPDCCQQTSSFSAGNWRELSPEEVR